jgi:DsbC/DsbD-like thiol-disulfide interchange protein
MMQLLLLTLLLGAPGFGLAQAPGAAKWETSLQPARLQGVLVVDVTAQIEKGWHIYALSQPPGGPTPLRIGVEPGAPYELAGSITGTAPMRHHDPSFDLETQFYSDSFTLKVPVKATSGSATKVPLAVRFQMCSETVCMPPRTVHLVTSNTPGTVSLHK